MARRSQANLIRVGPSGAVEAVFPGGLILPVTPGALSAGAAQRVDWERTSDGARVATLYSRESLGGDREAWVDTGRIAGRTARTSLVAGGAAAPYPTNPRIGVFKTDTRGGADVDAGSGEYALIMDSDGASEFIQTSYGLATDHKVVHYDGYDIAIGALAVNASATFGPLNSFVPFAGSLRIRAFGSIEPDTAALLTWGCTFTNVAGTIALTFTAHNPSAFVGSAAARWRGGFIVTYN